MKNNNRSKAFLVLLILVLTSVSQGAFAQIKKIKGTVVDEYGEPFVGATVRVKNTTNGTVTDLKGHFSIIAKRGDEIIISFLGMKPQNVKIGGIKLAKIVLQAMAQQVGEVIVTGYGNISKRKASSSVITLKAKDFKEFGATSIDNMLEGKVTGLAVMGSSSTPGAAPKIRIRGSSSISGSREPIWVVDGVVLEDPVPISATELNSMDKVNLIGNAISSINPEDISRIDVLKDASATAIYGTRAANGVIVVTTKNGDYGPARVRYSSSYTVNTRPGYEDLNLMNSKQRMEVSQEIHDKALVYATPPASIGYEGALYQYYSKQLSYAQFAQKVKNLQERNTDWFDELFRDAYSQKHSISVSGANKLANYYFSGGFNNTDATVKGSGLKQYNALMKMKFNISDKFRAHFQVRGSTMKKEYLHSTLDAYKYAISTSRVISPDEYYNDKYIGNNKNTITRNFQNDIDHSGKTIETTTLNFNAGVSYKVTPWISFSTLASINKSNTSTEEWMGAETYWSALQRGSDLANWDNTDKGLVEDTKLPIGGEYKSKFTKNTSYMFRSSFIYKREINKYHDISGSIGMEIRSNQYDGLSSTQRGYLPDRGKEFAVIDPSVYPAYNTWLMENPNGITDRLSNFISYYATATYMYDMRYSFNFNYRADGSNKFGQDPDNRFLPVWSSSIKWNLMNEHFMGKVKFLSQFSIKASYGVQGNVHADQTPNLIIKQGSIDEMSNQFSSTIQRLPNDKLRWEKTTSKNFGVDFGFFKSRFSGSFEVYHKLGTDQIVSRKVSTTSGRSSMSINYGTMDNRGWEIILNASILKTKDWKASISVNASQNINKVTDTGSPTDYTYSDYVNGRIISENEPINTFYSYKYAGLNNKGLPTFHDLDENGETKDEMYAKVFSVSGTRTPDFTGGINLSLKYTRFTLSANFSYSLGKKIRLNKLYSSSGQRLPKPEQNMSAEFTKRWQQPGDEKNTDIPALSTDPLKLNSIFGGREVNIGSNMWALYNNSDLRVVSGDYIRLRSLSLKYRLHKSICKASKVLKSASVSLSGSNLWLKADDKLEGQDPDHIAGLGTAPLTPSYTLSLSVTF